VVRLNLSGHVYFDTNIFIYALEGYQAFRAVMTILFEALDRRDFVVPVSREVLIAAAHLRADANLKLPDAIHVATAQLTGCEQFLTNDTHVPTLRGFTVRLLSELSP